MAIVFSAALKEAIRQERPRWVRRAYLIKNPFEYSSWVMLDISDKVISWGVLNCATTAASEDWEKPNLTMLVKNINNELNKYHASSWWKTAPVMAPGEVMLSVQIFVWTATSTITPELALSYKGRIEDAALKHSEDDSAVELVTVMWQNKGLQRTITKQSGGRLYQPANTVHTPPGIP